MKSCIMKLQSDKPRTQASKVAQVKNFNFFRFLLRTRETVLLFDNNRYRVFFLSVMAPSILWMILQRQS